MDVGFGVWGSISPLSLEVKSGSCTRLAVLGAETGLRSLQAITNFPFVPTLKVVTTTGRFNILEKDMDINAGLLNGGIEMQDLAAQVFKDMMLDKALRSFWSTRILAILKQCQVFVGKLKQA